MSTYRHRYVWHTGCQARRETEERLRYPLHYHLKKLDFIAFKKELQSGTQPFMTDPAGRTPLDLAITLFEDLVESGLCSSFPLDSFIEKSFQHDMRRPYKSPTYVSAYENLNDRLEAAHLSGKHSGPRVAPSSYQRMCVRHDPYPYEAYELINGGILDIGTNPLRPTKHADLLFHRHISLVVSDFLSRPMAAQCRVLLRELGQRATLLMRVIQELSSSGELMLLSAKFLQSRSETKAQILPQMGYPYLYLALIESLIQRHDALASKLAQAKPVNPQSVSAARALVDECIARRSRGAEAAELLRGLLKQLGVLSHVYGPGSFDPEYREYFLHAAVVLGCPELFRYLCEGVDVSDPDALVIFDWNEMLAEMQRRPKRYAGFVQPLTNLKVRTSLQTSQPGQSVSPRQLTDDMLEDVGKMPVVGKNYQRKLEMERSKWQYPVLPSEDRSPTKPTVATKPPKPLSRLSRPCRLSRKS
ncbi:MAG: hypothetical protein KVP17_003838 [Porospora cf. gigantea B]|uniref:uncharacterized protein n=3 Tax=Porospora cf. gigantea B TaxID=2853592 RepID=UPI0035719BB1|nr:MAG: hypothetical protein KVP17_003838 [Porospora cf. gigantea B]